MAALLTSVRDDKDKSAIYLAECRRMGIRVLPPCVNQSDADFTPAGSDIRFGLTAVRNVGTNVVASVVATRTAKGAFADFGDFLRKVDAVVCNKRTIEGLIKGGAFDSLGHTRKGLILCYEAAVDAVLDTKRNEAIGQFDLFAASARRADSPVEDVFAVRVPDGEWDKKVLLQFEREMLGLYVSDHPLFGLEHVLAGAADVTIASIQADAERRAAERDAGRHPVVGEPAGDQGRRALGPGGAGGPRGRDRGDVLPGDVRAGGAQRRRGRDRRDQGPHRCARRHGQAHRERPDVLDTSEARRGPLELRIEATRCTPPLIGRLKDVLTTHPGHDRGAPAADEHQQPRVVLDCRVSPSAALMGDLKALLGPAAVSA